MIGHRRPNEPSGLPPPAYAGVVKLPVPLRRLCYRTAHWLLRGWWLVRRPALSGVKCVVVDGDRILLVRHTYGARHWDVPGGGMRRGEAPRSAARREMGEELGLTDADWRTLGFIKVDYLHRHDTVHLFTAELDARTITVDPGEIAAARWFEPNALPADVGPFVETILARLPDPG
jgi:ADP-ribose pyrophosphatase YjhB (NUDIX family)